MTGRRQFLETATLAWLHAMTQGRASAARQQEHIVVVGAGMSGLAAARELRAFGYTVTVLEGRDRIGGRIWTNRDLGFPIDMGASWIHGVDGNPLTEIARHHRIDVQETDAESVRLWGPDGEEISVEDLEEAAVDYEDLSYALEEIADELDDETDISIEEGTELALAEEELSDADEIALSWFASAFLVLSTGAETYEHSLLYADTEHGFSGGDVLLPNGYDQIIDAVAQGTDIKLGHQVRAVDYSGPKVRVETNRGSFEADRVIVTLPLGVLRSGAVEFSPPLPQAKTEAISRLGVGALDKIVLRFSEAFWPQDRDYIGFASETPGEFPLFLNAQRFTGQPVLTGLVGGELARALEEESDEDVAEYAMEILREIGGDDIPDPVAGLASRWASDPFAAGSRAYIPVGASPRDLDAMAAPVGERLLFAGEATIQEYYGTVHGAYLSGMREAERIIG